MMLLSSPDGVHIELHSSGKTRWFMSTVQWIDEAQTLLLVDITLEPDNIPDLEARMGAILRAMDQIRGVSHPVDLIIDLRHAGIVAMGNWLMYFRFISTRTPHNIRHVVIVGSRARTLLQRTLDLIDRVQQLPTESITFVQKMKQAQIVLGLHGHQLEDIPN